MAKYEIIKVTLKIPSEWREKIDEIMSREGYTSYAEFLRALIRERLKRA